MDDRTITKCRLANQQLFGTKLKSPRDVVTWMGAMQAQDYPGSIWAIGLRLKRTTQTDVEKAIADRQIVRTWPMRGTLHFVSAEDIKWMIELMTPRVITNSTYRDRNLELTDEIYIHSKQIFTKALQGDQQLSRSSMCDLLEAAGISTRNQRGIHILWRLSQEGLLCFATHRGKQPWFALLSDWIPGAKSLPRDESLAKIAYRYFTSHGPATTRDFMWWSGLIAPDAKAGLEAVKHKLVSAKIDNKEYWMAKSQPGVPDEPSLCLLPGFDEYMLGYKDRSAALESHHSKKVVPGGNGMFLPTIVINGKIAGLWKKKLKTKSVEITPLPFEKLDEEQAKALRIVAKSYGEFIGLPSEVV